MWFVKATGSKLVAGDKVEYNVAGDKVEYNYFSRSGFFKEQRKGMRGLKTQGSSKIDSYCTASIRLTHI